MVSGESLLRKKLNQQKGRKCNYKWKIDFIFGNLSRVNIVFNNS